MINLHQLSAEDFLILLCCHLNLGREQRQQVDNLVSLPLDWAYVNEIAYTHGVSGLVYHHLAGSENKDCIPVPILEQFRKEFCRTAFKNLIFLSEFDGIVSQCNHEHIKIMPLKGIVLLKEFYNDNIGLRSLADIDILVEKKDLVAAGRLLRALGYTQKRESPSIKKRHFHSLFWRRKSGLTICVELHWDVDFSDSPFSINIDDIWCRAEKSVDKNRIYYRPSCEDSIVLNSFHIVRGARLRIAPLKNFYDILNIIKKHADQINWQIVMQRSGDYNITRPVSVVLLLLQNLFQVAIPLDLADLLKKTGFHAGFTEVIVKRAIFSRRSAPDAIPLELSNVMSDRKISKAIAFPFKIVKIFFKEHKKNYYADFEHSINRSMLISFSNLAKSFFVYMKTFYYYLIQPAEVKKKIERAAKEQQEMSAVNQWLKGKS